VQLESRSGRKERPRHRWWKAVQHRLRRHPVLLSFVVGLGLLGAAGYVLARPGSAEPGISLLEASRQAVRLSLREDLRLRANFSDAAETSINDQSGGKHLVRGWVDLISESGAVERQSYSCILYRNHDGEWLADNITVLPQ